ncbi:MAG TPA: GEVED domain-containing protein, partial [Bacteroidales bacterium]|nr:GEVED domain-containing protein [Bacteroidales bacterium]
MKRLFTQLTVLLSMLVLINSALQAQTPCAASGGCDEYISNVVIGTITNPTACSNYANYTTMSTLVVPGMTYPITVSNGNPYSSDQCGIWVDWNHDNTFQTTEAVTVSGTPGNGPYTANITVPPTALPGATRIRIRITYTGTVDPCGTTTYGEVEDYTLMVASSSALDAGIVGITSPVHPNSPGLHSVSAVLMNFGTSTLTSATLGYSVDGVTGTPYSWTGSLPNLGKDTVTVGSTTLANGLHNVKVWSSAPNAGTDSFSLNDTFQIQVLTATLLNGVYTIGGPAADFPDFVTAIGAATAAGIGGPVTFNVNPGTYTGQLTIPPIMGVSAS